MSNPARPTPDSDDEEVDNNDLKQELEGLRTKEASPRRGQDHLKVAKPPKFDGTKREELQGFLTQLRSYFRFNPFNEEADKVLFAATYLEGRALEWSELTQRDYLELIEDERKKETNKIFEAFVDFEDAITQVFGIFDKRSQAERSESDGDALKRRFYDGLKDDVKDELIKEERDALTLDAYMARAIAIDNRQYERRQERTGKKDAVYPKANDKKKRQPQSTSHGTHSGPMDIGAAQAQWAGRKGGAKDKSGITCYNCDKKGHVKRNCHSKKEWRPVPGKEAVTIDQATVGKKVRIQEVAAASYTQDDLEVDIEQALKREDELTGSDSDNSELGNEYALITSDDEGKVAPPRHIQQAAQDWSTTLTQQADGEWTTHTGDGKVRPSLFFLQQRILEQRQRIEELVREKEELKQLLQARNDQYERLRTELDSIKEGVRELTSTHEDIGRHIDGIGRETQAMREAQERAWTDHAPWDRPTEHAEECGDGVHYPEQEYTWAEVPGTALKQTASSTQTKNWKSMQKGGSNSTSRLPEGRQRRSGMAEPQGGSVAPRTPNDRRRKPRCGQGRLETSRGLGKRLRALRGARRTLTPRDQRKQAAQHRKNWRRRKPYNDLPADEYEAAAVRSTKPDNRLWIAARWGKFEALALVDGGAQMNLISPTFVNQFRIPWRIKGKEYIVKGPFDTQWARRETEPLDMEVAGKTTQVVFDIVDMGPEKDIILGRPWHEDYDPDISWKGDGHLRPREPREHPTDLMKERAEQEPRMSRGSERTPSTGPPQETASAETRTLESGRSGTRQQKQTREARTIAVVSVDEHGKLKHEAWVNRKEAAGIELPAQEIKIPEASFIESGNKFAYYEGTTKNATTGKIPDELQGDTQRSRQNILQGCQITDLGTTRSNSKERSPSLKFFQGLNNERVKNRYPLPLIARLRDQLSGAQYYTRLDLPTAYAHIRIKEGDEWKTAFRTPYGHYEYLVMPFGLTNAPATFQAAIDHAIRHCLDKFAVCYLDDILIYSKTLEEHKEHVRQVLDALHEHKLSVNKDKSEFHVKKTVFLEVRGFIGFANFVRMFIKNFGDIARPLHELTKKGTTFQWKQEHERAFQRMRNAITADPVLMLPDPSKPFEVEADASDFAIGGQLGQRDKDGKLHPVAFFSKKLEGPRLNEKYPIHDKELLAVTRSIIQEWRPYLGGTTHEVQVYTDHKNLRYFTTTKVLNGRQTRWAEFLSEFNFTIHYKKGSENARADALSRRADHHDNTSEASPPLLHQQTDGSPRHASQPTEDYEIAALQQQLEDPEARPLQPFVECCAVFRERRLERDFQGIIADDERDKWREEPESKIAGLRLEGTRLWYHDKAYIRPSDQKELI
ncbi:hypothetical protein CHGG_08708 [Chaetomium globosum CBS 148.51]|uniref:RNA-directed DNA polymerase n=1 Tax=Chaetomium globosum (strain ATCC 6205 / CBS 148.51 / DSM 1962 / NBRC 6347 / NRRL 1970) TaxID=306901 RepID=Q2GTJ6_CHAGB|nr:uncharacterized protein CHGG_08708 [Chaetomium globosum CBS 148.51]EAQ84694.1 hypothetical protein CHGG_08708 [Chaetomium globosum CBS 148.51]